MGTLRSKDKPQFHRVILLLEDSDFSTINPLFMDWWWSKVVGTYLSLCKTTCYQSSDCSGLFHQFLGQFVTCCVVASMHFILVTESGTLSKTVWSSLTHTGKQGHSRSTKGHFETSMETGQNNQNALFINFWKKKKEKWQEVLWISIKEVGSCPIRQYRK